jgi:alkanesulfonate monooxygenase SsuD/methylene tetrahydromethanopterin reductase-like flavin-dependent oxidoreductase (luciferase family)
MPMEFGIFVQGYIPKWKSAADPDAEHTALMEDLQLAIAADKAGFKYVWASEHHFLEEYSHLSANDVFLGYLAHATERIHLGSGIFNPLPQVNHPAKVAERVAMLDHLSGNRFEFGTGRGAGSHEILGFLPGMDDLSGTKEIWEDVIAEFPKMWLQDEYEGYQGKFWSLPPRKILPKPWGPGHPAMWYAAGNPSSYEMAAHKGLGVGHGFLVLVEDRLEVGDGADGEAQYAEPIGAFVNDNVMVCTAAFVSEDKQAGYQKCLDARLNYLQSNVFRYHDTFPHPEGVPYWPEIIPDLDQATVEVMAEVGAAIVGDPDQALEQCRRWEAAGCDQISFGVSGADLEASLETIRLLGEHVIPKIDTEPLHSTTRYRQAAAKA